MKAQYVKAFLICASVALAACGPDAAQELADAPAFATHQDSLSGDLPADNKDSLLSTLSPQFILQTGTTLHETYSNFDFATADWNRDGYPDLFAIKKHYTGTGSTEVHILSGAAKFQRFILQTGTVLHETYDNFDFAVADWNRDGYPDLIAIKKHYTGTGSTEVHVLSGAASFQRFILQTGTVLHETYDNFDFVAGDWNRDGYPDLFAIKKHYTGTGSTEMHILSGAASFRRFILQTGTVLHETYGNFDFVAGDWNRDGYPDLFAIKKHYTGTGSTEVHVLSGAASFRRFILQTGTVLHETYDNFDFVAADWNWNGVPDLFAIKKHYTGTGSTEVHILGL